MRNASRVMLKRWSCFVATFISVKYLNMFFSVRYWPAMDRAPWHWYANGLQMDRPHARHLHLLAPLWTQQLPQHQRRLRLHLGRCEWPPPLRPHTDPLGALITSHGLMDSHWQRVSSVCIYLTAVFFLSLSLSLCLAYMCRRAAGMTALVIWLLPPSVRNREQRVMGSQSTKTANKYYPFFKNVQSLVHTSFFGIFSLCFSLKWFSNVWTRCTSFVFCLLYMSHFYSTKNPFRPHVAFPCSYCSCWQSLVLLGAWLLS